MAFSRQTKDKRAVLGSGLLPQSFPRALGHLGDFRCGKWGTAGIRGSILEVWGREDEEGSA